jgi:squalene-hopene/tetraprenyl-beta-curcumene cyclase
LRRGSAAADAALQRAINFLLNRRTSETGNDSCHWRDFDAYGSESDEWVTAYVAYALAETSVDRATQAAVNAWYWLVSQGSAHGTGLGYSRSSPQDADSTAWGLRLAETIGRSTDEFAKEAFRHLTTYLHKDGGIGTFAAADLQKIGFGDSDEAVAGWTASHNCVTSTAAWLRELSEFGDVYGFLARTQEAAGFWRAYWWPDLEYATAHAVESFVRAGVQPEAAGRAVRWLRQNGRNRSPFALALRVLGLSKAGASDSEAALQALIALQLADGSWPESARMQIPPPCLKDPQIQWNWDEHGNGIGSVIVDRKRIFTTATAVRAISAWLMQ